MAAVGRISAVPSILKIICDETGMGFAAIARVSDSSWTACAVHDKINFGLKAGGQLELQTTLCYESRAARAPIVVDRFSEDLIYRDHHTSAIYGLESYISVPIILPNGEYFGNLCAIDARPAQVSSPRVIRMFEVFASLLAMQLDNERRQISTEALLSSERETAALREQFIAVLGHDLRNPLSAVNATAQMLLIRPDPELVTAGQRLKRTVTRMARLIDDVMDFARGRLGGGLSLSLQTVDDLGGHLQSAIDELRDANPGRNVVCDIESITAVRADLGRLQQLLSNLLGNALTHGATEHPITVQVCRLATDIVIRVTNHGTPISPDTLARVFEPYWRPASSAPGGGLGLGLFICKQIVEAHGGILDVTSSVVDGTCFTARIPTTPR
ncbi:GAF domain-containing sensor histidine kinase [Robbsia andropogonis]|nr:GAF domain-containing sensor histidine kinase [Robbsia andropogonis]MCP1116538.1 GAF domain-containing sensor histidine kinase [Robbsia andropogonis]MCP1126783.1 GAF domain-containing sensor histidine kinase [Robbsia andropogonis]